MKLSKLALIAPLLTSTNCGPWMTEGDYYHVMRKGAEMPIWVRGNIASGIFLVTLHGGPGHSGHDFVLSEGFRALEEDYAVVYWDQRASGLAKGNPSPDTFTLEDFVADTDAVIGAMQDTYGFDEFFLLGHSWGGALGTAFLIDGAHRDEVSGWISVDGDHNLPLSVAESRLWMIDTIEQLIAENTDAEHWSEILEWYEENPVFLPSDPRHYSYLSTTGGYFYRPEDYVQPPYAELTFASPYSMGTYQNYERSIRLTRPLTDGLDLSDRMGEITTPSLFLWGEEDGAVPVAIGEDAFELIGTPDEDKSLVVISECAHSAHDEVPERFTAEVSGFIEGVLEARL
ncbi:MAG: alpha/beta hydrolase [Nannocystaceae bacterium]